MKKINMVLAATAILMTSSIAVLASTDESVQAYSEAATIDFDTYGAKGALADDDLTVEEMLLYAVQDEYLAREEYTVIMDALNAGNPYVSIKQSEETHLAALEKVYANNDMAFPENEIAGLIKPPSDLLAAGKAGVQAEIDNIAMYEEFLTHDLPDDVRRVFESLEKASENHLKAFQKQVDKLS